MTIGIRTVLPAVIGVLASGCGPAGSSVDGGALPPAFSGVFVGPFESGTIDLLFTEPTTGTAQVSVTGSLLIESMNAPIMLSGSFDASEGAATFSGSVPGQIGMLTCNGWLQVGRLDGACTGADFEVRYFSAGDPRSGSFFRYCGTAMGNSLRNVVWNLFRSGTVVGGVYGNGAVQGGITGTTTGKELSMTLTPSGSATGQVSGTSVTGTWTIESLDGSLPPDTGTFSGSTLNCP